LGLALPFLFLSLWPFLQRLLPKPGVWMERFKQGLAFPMYGAAVWLVWVLAQQTGVNAVAATLGGMVVIAFAAWLYEFTRSGSKTAQWSGTGFAAMSLGLALFGGYYGVTVSPAALSSTIHPSQNSEPYTAARLNELRSQGKPVFLNLTAAWCISCLVNEKIALSQDSVIATFKRTGITYLKGDWTNRDEEITRILAEFGRSGVPLYVFYPAGTGKSANPVVLPQLLTPEIVETAVTRPTTALAIGKVRDDSYQKTSV
jgi:thiol:disulfide interchange protein